MRLRKEAGLNQAVLAARLRITQSEVSKYERGERILSETRLHAWLSALTPPAQESPVAGPTPSLGPAGLAPARAACDIRARSWKTLPEQPPR